MGTIDVSKVLEQKEKKASGKKSKETKSLLQRDIQLFGSGIKDKTKAHFYSELNILFSAGVDIRTALELIEDELEKKKEKAVFGKIRDSVVSGNSLSEALNETGKFSAYEYHSLRIGEESGKLVEVLTDLSNYFENRIKQRRQLIGSLSYPILVMTTSFGAIFFMLYFVVPLFNDVFKRFGGDLPALTKAILGMSEWVSGNIGYIAVLIVGVIVAIMISKKQLWYRRMASWLLLKLPVFGDLMHKIYLARFCTSMTLLISAKTPIVKSIQLVRLMVGFYPLEKSLEEIEQKILRGGTLHEGMSEYSIYNKRMTSLIKVAEEVNQLDVIFGKLADQYAQEAEHKTKTLSSLLEPLLIIFLGAIVGIILVAMYLPMFQLSTSFQAY